MLVGSESRSDRSHANRRKNDVALVVARENLQQHKRRASEEMRTGQPLPAQFKHTANATAESINAGNKEQESIGSTYLVTRCRSDSNPLLRVSRGVVPLPNARMVWIVTPNLCYEHRYSSASCLTCNECVHRTSRYSTTAPTLCSSTDIGTFT